MKQKGSKYVVLRCIDTDCVFRKAFEKGFVYKGLIINSIDGIFLDDKVDIAEIFKSDVIYC